MIGEIAVERSETMKPRPEGNTAHRSLPTALKCCFLLSLVSCAAIATPVQYTFTATTRASLGSPSHTEAFDLVLPDFMPLVQNGPVISFLSDDPALRSCVACVVPSVPALHFLRSTTNDLIQFVDEDGTNRLYMFPLNVLSTVGRWDTLSGINVNRGTVVVSATPEPATIGMLLIAAAVFAALYRRRMSLDG